MQCFSPVPLTQSPFPLPVPTTRQPTAAVNEPRRRDPRQRQPPVNVVKPTNASGQPTSTDGKSESTGSSGGASSGGGGSSGLPAYMNNIVASSSTSILNSNR